MALNKSNTMPALCMSAEEKEYLRTQRFNNNRPSYVISGYEKVESSKKKEVVDINESAEAFINRFKISGYETVESTKKKEVVDVNESAEFINRFKISGYEKVESSKKKEVLDVNESAEAFINRFKHQLKMERLNSIENYKQYLERGL